MGFDITKKTFGALGRDLLTKSPPPMPALRNRLLLALLLVVAPLHAEPVPGGEVHVERSDRAFDCPNEAELVKAALALGTAPTTPGTTPISIAVRFDRAPSAYVASVSASGQKAGERELRADDPDCRRLADSVAVVLAVLLDLVPPEAAASFEPLASNEPGPSAPAAKSTVTAAVAPPPVTPPVAPPPSPSETSTPFFLSLRAEGALAFGLLGSAVTPYVGGAVALGRGRFAAALGGDWVAPRTVPFSGSTAVHLGLAYGFADGCFRAVPSSAAGWDTSLCARFAAGVFAGDGRGFDHHFPQQKAWFAAGPQGAIRYRFGPALALRFDALLLVLLGHQTLVVQDQGAAFKSSPLAAGLGFGPELTIW